MEFTLKINMDNDSFAERPLGELAECLNHVVNRLCLAGNDAPQVLFDLCGTIKCTNGNTIGRWSIDRT